PISAILANFETATKLPSSPEAEIKSQKWQMVAGENGLPCEWPFGGTASIGGNGGVVYGTVGASGNGSYDNLEKGLPAVITEENFSDWSSEDILDNTVKSNGWGSGDMEDLEAEMNKIQKNQRIFHANPTDYTQWYYDHLNYDTIVPVLKKALDDYTPTIIGISWSTSAHAMLALKYIDQGNGDFALKVLDPNTHNLAYVDCSKSAKGPMFPGIGFLYTVKCSFYLDGKLKNGEMFNSLNGVPDIDCSSKSSRVRPEPTEWLLKGATNWPSFVNPNFPNSPDGNCFGWSYVTRLVACFGDFAGYDFHSGDSYTVGAGCDANHYPNMDYINSHPSLLIQKSAKSAWLNSANWLGNVLTPLLKLWPMKRMF
ncbi:MAG: hypothetical protein NTV48_01470, partial [Candidatus Vogelbacteria bacterium]|nr:hypothetical protein [Candidatus Vogelbacteria bacterium]